MNIAKDINKTLERVFAKQGFDVSLAVCSYSDRPELADYQCNASFQIAKTLRRNPVEIAKELVTLLNDEGDGFIYSHVNAFINISFSSDTLLSYLRTFDADGRFGIESSSFGKVILDYGGPNIAKPLHVGHLRSAIIGESIKRISKFMGNEVICCNYFGDWGFPMGLVIASIMEKYDMGWYFGENVPKVIISNEELNIIYPEASKRSKIDEEFKGRALKVTKLLQTKTKGYYDIWEMIKEASYGEMSKLFGMLGVHFDVLTGESEAEPYIPVVAKILASKGLLEESQGALIVDVKEEADNEPMPPLRIKSASGAYLYETTELATIYKRMKESNPDEIWYVTDFRQKLHFLQAFRAARKAEIVGRETKLVHIPYGTMNGPDGKPFKTRSGDVMKLEDFIQMVKVSVINKMQASGRAPSDALAQKIGIAAIKFGDLINSPSKNYSFDLDKFCSFEGKTGPYILYTVVRIKSILQKLGGNAELSKIVLEGGLRAIATSVLKFTDDFREAYESKSPSFIAASLYTIAMEVNTFYNLTHILSEKNAISKFSYAKVLEIAVNTLAFGCEMLGIEVPDRM